MNISTYKKKSFGKIKLFRKIYTHHQKNPPSKSERTLPQCGEEDL